MNKIARELPFLLKMITATLVGMTFLIGFSRLTMNYEISLVYIAIGFVILIWVLYGFMRRGL